VACNPDSRSSGGEGLVIRRLITLSAVGILVWLLLRIVEISPSATPAESTFMLGFALLSAALLGEIVEHLRLPRITGYMLAGILFGPFAANLLSSRVLEPLSALNDMAFAFIGLAAGAELKLAILRGRWRSIVLLIVCTATVVMTGVCGFFFVTVSWLGFLGDLPLFQVLAVAGMVGVIAAARSPSSAIAIIAETKADGPFSETILGVSVAMDVVVICLFAVATAVAGLAFAPDQGLDLVFVFEVIGEIVISIALGLLLGAIIGLYLKRKGPQVSLVIVGLCFLVYRSSEIMGHYLEETHRLGVGLEPLLICAAAGFTIQNLSHQGNRLIGAMDRVALPVYVVFFTMTGARLDLGALAASWGIALAIAGFRITMIMLGTRLATSLARDPKPFRRYCWLGFVTQAGLSLALISEFESNFPDWGTAMATVLVAVVAINQLIGPVAFKMALEKVGEARTGSSPGKVTS
jgi:Kef-type K+ transport system membrane component KefB